MALRPRAGAAMPPWDRIPRSPLCCTSGLDVSRRPVPASTRRARKGGVAVRIVGSELMHRVAGRSRIGAAAYSTYLRTCGFVRSLVD